MPPKAEDFESTKEKNKMANTMGTIRIIVDGVEWNGETAEGTAQAIEMWWDKHRRHWELWPVDENGYQLAETTYAFNRAEALKVKKELAEEYGLH